jgi:hypothetical protein
LIEIVREIELPFAAREGSSGIAGAYTGIPADVAFLPSRHFLGEPDPDHSDGDERPYIFICECGEPGCWPLLVRIELRESEVVWSDFCQPHRGPNVAGEWRYNALPSFTFDRKSYEQALSARKRAV